MKKYFLIAAILCGLFAKAQSELPLFKNNETVCFIGNSITHGGSYHTFVQLFCATRFPKEKVFYFNCGISGDPATGMLRRFEKDILSRKPDHAFLMTGMNDVNIRLYSKEKNTPEDKEKQQKAIEYYYKQTEKLAQKLVENNIKPIFMTPTIYDQTAKIERTNYYGANDALATCAVHIRKLAKKYNGALVDLHPILQKINLSQQAKDSTFTIIGHDRVHPKDPGHLVMANEIIKTVLPSEYVSKIEIQAKKKKVLESLNCSVTDFKKKKNCMEFTVLENALPFPIKEELHTTLNMIPNRIHNNKEILQIQKLKKGNYQFLIDDTEIAIFSSEELQKGIDLSHYSNTPQYQQAEIISDLCFQYRKLQKDIRSVYFIEFTMLKDYKGDGSLEDVRKFMDVKIEKQRGQSWHGYMLKTQKEYFENLPKQEGLKIKLEEVRNQIYTLNQPKEHKYTLTRVD